MRGADIPKLMIFITEKVPASLRGELTRWMLELKPGIFIGTLSKLVGEKLWNKIKEKQSKGGAFWVSTLNNEQRFSILSCGSTQRTIRDFDGMQLITKPIKRKKESRSQKEFIQKKRAKKELKKKIPINRTINWDVQGTPQDFIIRKAFFNNKNSSFDSFFTGSSAYFEYPPDKIWTSPWKDEIIIISKELLNCVEQNMTNFKLQLTGKRIMSIDIETTDFLPKAFEGFINVIGVAILSLPKNKQQNSSLEIFQACNMTRKKARVPELISLFDQYFKNIDLLLVFNRDFDIKILNTVISQNNMHVSLPNNIVDLQEYFLNLRSLEQYLTQQNIFKRKLTSKEQFQEYYKLFKGEGYFGINKQLEPLATYNITDCLSPLLAFFVLFLKNKVELKL